MTLKIKISKNQIGTAIDYFANGEWRCLELFHGELNAEKIRQSFNERATALGIKFEEVA